jgi:hypothetical protein
MDREGGVIDRRHAGRQTGPTSVVTVLVPPTVFQEVQAVFDSPVLADVPKKISGGDLTGIKAAYVVASVMQHDFAIVST